MNRFLIISVLSVCVFTNVNSQFGPGRGRGLGFGGRLGMRRKMGQLAKNFQRVSWMVMATNAAGKEVKLLQIALYNETQKVVLIVTRANTQQIGFSPSITAYDFNANEMYIRSRESCGPAKLGSLGTTFDALLKQIKRNSGKQLKMGGTVYIKAEDSNDSSPNTQKFCQARFFMTPEIKQYTTFTPGSGDSTNWKIIGMDKVYEIYETTI